MSGFEPKTYRHMKIARYLVGGFEFKDFHLTLYTPEDVKKFEDAMKRQPARESRDIVISDEKPMIRLGKSRVVRHAQDSSSVTSKTKDGGVRELSQEQIAEAQARAYADAKAEMTEKAKADMEAEIRKQVMDEMQAEANDGAGKDEPDPEKESKPTDESKTEEPKDNPLIMKGSSKK